MQQQFTAHSMIDHTDRMRDMLRDMILRLDENAVGYTATRVYTEGFEQLLEHVVQSAMSVTEHSESHIPLSLYGFSMRSADAVTIMLDKEGVVPPLMLHPFVSGMAPLLLQDDLMDYDVHAETGKSPAAVEAEIAKDYREATIACLEETYAK